MDLPVGHAGSWFAKWNGESLPCIHQHAIKGSRYIDEGVNEHPAWPKFIEELREKQRAIITTSHPAGDDGVRRRKSYVGVWEVDNVHLDGTTLTFDIGTPIERFRK